MSVLAGIGVLPGCGGFSYFDREFSVQEIITELVKTAPRKREAAMEKLLSVACLTTVVYRSKYTTFFCN